MTSRYGWASVVALAIIGLAAALALSIALPMALRFVLASFGDVDGDLLQPIVSLASALLAFAGVGISGLVGLQVLRRDRAENTGAEARAIAAALSGECDDIAGMFSARTDLILKQLKDDDNETVSINLSDVFPLPSVIYEAVSPKIGLLGVELARSTVVSYGRVLVWKNYGERTMTSLRWAHAMHRQQQLAGLFAQQAKALADFAGLKI